MGESAARLRVLSQLLASVILDTDESVQETMEYLAVHKKSKKHVLGVTYEGITYTRTVILLSKFCFLQVRRH